ncbi:MAG: electron transport complex subunit E [Lentisphaerae bacterium]|jgi:electron transport complex protein RnfE|nr:electron transport complex subunit E [Lentisphaerota bacterium]
MSALKTLSNGIWRENPVFILMLGMCPTLAVSSSAKNALGMGLATTFVLAGSNLVISLCRKWIPDKVRIPCYIVIIATFVTVVEQLMKAYAPPELNRTLGIYIPLIVVNCIVLGRAEAFASKNGMFASLLDGLGMGLGFTLALMMLGAVREFIADGTLFELAVIPNWPGIHLLKTPTGAFIVLAFFLAAINQSKIRKCRQSGMKYEPPEELSCRSCSICKMK